MSDSFFNQALGVLTSVKRKISVRALMDQFEQSKEFVHLLNTGLVGKLLPTIQEQFGDDKNIDIKVTLSHKKILEAVGK